MQPNTSKPAALKENAQKTLKANPTHKPAASPATKTPQSHQTTTPHMPTTPQSQTIRSTKTSQPTNRATKHQQVSTLEKTPANKKYINIYNEGRADKFTYSWTFSMPCQACLCSYIL